MKIKFFILILVVLLSVSPAFAIQWTSQKNVSPIELIGTNDPQYDSLLLEANGITTVKQEADILQSNPFYSVWQDVTVRGTGTGAHSYLIDNRVLNPGTGASDIAGQQVEFGVLRLEDVDFSMNSQPVFTDTLKGSAGIFLNNASFTAEEGPLQYSNTTLLTITAQAGDNRYTPAAVSTGKITSDTVIEVNSGASLTWGALSSSGRGNNTYAGAYSINLDNSDFTLQFFDEEAAFGQVNMVNGSTLTIGPEGRLVVVHMTVDSSTVNFDRFATNLLAIGTVTATDSTFNVEGNPDSSTGVGFDNLTVLGTNTIDLVSDQAKFVIGTLQSGGGVTQLDLQVGAGTVGDAITNVAVLKLDNDFTINLTNQAGLAVTSLEASGGTVNVDYESTLNLGSKTTTDTTISGLITSGSTATTINSSGSVILYPGANLELGPITLNMTGAPSLNPPVTEADPKSYNRAATLNVEGGILSGTGSVGDDITKFPDLANIVFESQGQLHATGDYLFEGTLSPGTAANPFGSISTDANVIFYASAAVSKSYLSRSEYNLNLFNGLFDGGRYQVDVGVEIDNTAPLNPVVTKRSDQLLYGAENIQLQLLKELQVRTPINSDARDLDGETFTVIQAQGPGVAGTIELFGQTINVVEDASVPALIDFTVLDLNTDTKSDLTLRADSSAVVNILKHPSVKPAHTLATTATTTVSGGQATTVVTTVLPAQTGSTGTASTKTTAKDPATGNKIVTTVSVAPNPDSNGGSLQTVTKTVTSPTDVVLSQHTQTTALKVPTTAGTANQAVTTLVTPATGGSTSSNTTTTGQPQATGSANKVAAANLLVNSANAGNTATASSLNTLTNAQVDPHLESIHAEPYSSYMTISLEHTDMVMNTVLNQAARDGVFSAGRSYEAIQSVTKKLYLASAAGMDTASDAVEITRPETLRRTWIDVSYNEGDVDGDGNLGDFEYNLSSLTVGQDLVATDDRTLGAFFSFGTQEMDEHDNAVQDFDGDSYYLGLYMNKADVGRWDLRGVLGYAYGDHGSRRTVVLSNSISTPSAGFDSHSAYVGVKGTVDGYQNDWVTLTPELGLNYTYYKQKSFTESGDPDLSLIVDSADAQALIVSAGANARFASLSETNSVYPLAFVRYEYDFYANHNNEHEIDAALVSHPDYKQTFVGQNRGEHALTGGLALGSDLTSALQIRGGLKYTVHSHGSEWGAGLNMQYLW